MSETHEKREKLLSRFSRGVAYTAPALALMAGGAAFQANAEETAAVEQGTLMLAEAEAEGESEAKAEGEAEAEAKGHEAKAEGEAEGKAEAEGEGEAEGKY